MVCGGEVVCGAGGRGDFAHIPAELSNGAGGRPKSEYRDVSGGRV